MLVNGKEMSFKDGITIEELLNELKIEAYKVVAEVDLNIIDKEEYAATKLTSDSKVELIRFVGGG
ncbi:sulfur carrier protein ThiS [Clostridium pasteurianum]|uniref:Thiamine biosynthesis protein ThiS n=1 Tax=Clostridium pasteurianum BC1 TaxID=86416 RepID=R4KGX3_CLOPA|nr:sulfur carrier protein ThiS [Clostridium pasteurianum]AGK98860.1 thiamine biosynthesis protein ThiS [Clostridium pasteurianum BC1]